LAVSSAMRAPVNAPVSGSARRVCAMYSSTTLVRSSCAVADAGTAQSVRAMMASTSRSSVSVNFSPLPEKTLMPLSSNGLCDAEMTMPASNPIAGVT
jgi:hypothetical protein